MLIVCRTQPGDAGGVKNGVDVECSNAPLLLPRPHACLDAWAAQPPEGMLATSRTLSPSRLRRPESRSGDMAEHRMAAADSVMELREEVMLQEEEEKEDHDCSACRGSAHAPADE